MGSHRIRPQYQRSFQACKWVWCNLIWTILSVPLVLSSTVYFSTPPPTPAQIVVPFTTLNSHLLLLATPNSHLDISQLVFLIRLFLAEVRTAPASPPTMPGGSWFRIVHAPLPCLSRFCLSYLSSLMIQTPSL